MNTHIVIVGANGFLGRYLCRRFALRGMEVVAIGRHREGWSGDGMFLEWDGRSPGPWALALEGAAAVINLAGSTVNCRYDEANRIRILSSRLESTAAIGEAIRRCGVPPRLWLNASTATWYRHAEDRPQDEWTGERGEGFSCEVARAWEEAFFSNQAPAATRKVALRIGMVLANEPGTVFDVLTTLAKRGLGGRMGNGRQRVSWIHMEDFLRALDFIAADPFLEGPVNVTAPVFPTNTEWMAAFRKAWGSPLGLPAPRWILKLGSLALRTETELVLKSRWARPTRLADAGFRWLHPTAAGAVMDLASRPGLDKFFLGKGSRSIGARGWIPAITR